MATPPSTVADAIEVLRKRIQQIRERKETLGEENTKATLIDPLLSALGWDLHEIDEVRREYRRKPQDNPVDYALFMNRTECLFIEAKSLEKDLADHRWVTQNLSYATAAGVQWCVLTNGDEYRIYNAHAPVAVEEKLFRSVRISETEVEYLTATLLLLSKQQMRGSLLDELWKRHFVDRRVHQALASLLAEQDSKLVNAIRKRAGELSPAEIRASLKRARIQVDFPAAVTMPEPRAEQAPKEKVASSPREAGKKAWETRRAAAAVTLADLIAAGLVRPPLELERNYKGVQLVAVVQPNGKVEFAGRQYDSLSTAAAVARKTVIGSPPDRPYPQTNGWTFWLYRDRDTGELCQMDYLRKQYLAARK